MNEDIIDRIDRELAENELWLEWFIDYYGVEL